MRCYFFFKKIDRNSRKYQTMTILNLIFICLLHFVYAKHGMTAVTLGVGPLSASNTPFSSSAFDSTLSRLSSSITNHVQLVYTIYVDSHNSPQHIYTINDQNSPLKTPNRTEFITALQKTTQKHQLQASVVVQLVPDWTNAENCADPMAPCYNEGAAFIGKNLNKGMVVGFSSILMISNLILILFFKKNYICIKIFKN